MTKNDLNIYFYDFEVFKKLWMVVIINYKTKEKHIIINNRNELIEFYNNHVNDIFVGYNSRNYDQFIFKGILDGIDPWKVNNALILEGKSGYQTVKNFKKYPFNNFDIQTGFHSLKQLEGFMGSTIKDSSVDFTIERVLTQSEIDEVLQYCIHDVEQTIEVFENLKEEFDSQLLLIEAFDLPMSMFSKTKAQLSAHVLGAEKTTDFTDEFQLEFPNTLVLSEKYKYVYDWYADELNRNYSKKLKTDISGVPHIFAWGGIHGAIPNYIGEGLYIMSDIASMYPALMIEYNFLSRNVVNPSKYREIRDKRIELKREKNPMQLPLKIVLNSTYGASKDKFNPLFDPLMANNVCVCGQLLLLDLIEKIEPYGTLIQSNTDGILVKVENEEMKEAYLKACDEWSKRTRLDLEHDEYVKVIQKDVNNYIIVDAKGKYKSKGAYVKKLNNIDYDLPILNDALINYFVHNISIEDTINNCNELIKFQQIIKKSGKYDYMTHGDVVIREKVLRVFASTNESDMGIYKFKQGGNPEKVPKTPEKAFIYNECVIGLPVPDKLDKLHYIEMAKSRLADFIDGRVKTSDKSNIKGISLELFNSITNVFDNFKFDNFLELLTHIYTNVTGVSKSKLETCIKVDMFSKYGESKYLENYHTLFLLFWDNKNKLIKNTITTSKVDKLQLSQDTFNEYGVKNGKNYEISSLDNLIKALLPVNLKYTPFEKIQIHIEYKLNFDYISNDESHKCITVIKELHDGKKPYGLFYSIGNGKTVKMLISNTIFEKLKLNSIVKCVNMIRVPKEVYMNGAMVQHETEKEWMLVEYESVDGGF